VAAAPTELRRLQSCGAYRYRVSEPSGAECRSPPERSVGALRSGVSEPSETESESQRSRFDHQRRLAAAPTEIPGGRAAGTRSESLNDGFLRRVLTPSE
jgi:hypothetical protein